MKYHTHASPDGTQKQGAGIGDDIQGGSILVDATQERLQSLLDFPADALVLVYLFRSLDFFQEQLGDGCSLEQPLLIGGQGFEESLIDAFESVFETAARLESVEDGKRG